MSKSLHNFRAGYLPLFSRKLNLSFLLALLMLPIFVACGDDDDPKPAMKPGGVEYFSDGNKDWVNGKIFVMPAKATTYIVELGSRGITEEGIEVMRKSGDIDVKLLDPYDPSKLTVYDQIKSYTGGDFHYDNLYKQRLLISAPAQPGSEQTDREIVIKVIPVGGYNVYSVFTVVHPKPSVEQAD